MKPILIYADGSSLGNPGPGGWGVVYSDGERVAELGGGDEHTTNNRMELTAAIEALKKVGKSETPVTLRTDSSYVIGGITKWVAGWKKAGWITANKKAVLNKDLWEKLAKLAAGKDITWEYVPGHAGVPGNERADFIATLCARERQFKKQKFFDGPAAQYPFDLTDVAVSKTRLPKKKKNTSAAYSYLSLVGGKVMRHMTWGECEKRVKGVSGAKFKKATSAMEEKAILDAWGIS